MAGVRAITLQEPQHHLGFCYGARRDTRLRLTWCHIVSQVENKTNAVRERAEPKLIKQGKNGFTINPLFPVTHGHFIGDRGVSANRRQHFRKLRFLLPFSQEVQHARLNAGLQKRRFVLLQLFVNSLNRAKGTNEVSRCLFTNAANTRDVV